MYIKCQNNESKELPVIKGYIIYVSLKKKTKIQQGLDFFQTLNNLPIFIFSRGRVPAFLNHV